MSPAEPENAEAGRVEDATQDDDGPPATSVRLRLRWVTYIYDALERRYEGEGARRWMTATLLMLFLGGILAAELQRRGIFVAERPVSHFVAVEVVFTWLLFIEVIGLVMGLVGSVANAMGKQIEIFSLILLRDAFKQFRNFGEPIEWTRVEPVLAQILADILGALALFVILAAFYRVQPHRPITRDAAGQAAFITVKKVVALVMLATFVGVAISDGVRILRGQPTFPFFDTFFTILIFADVFIVLASLRYTSTYAVVFRNSGYTLTTVLIRLALAAPPFVDVALGLTAALIALGLSVAYRFFPPPQAARSPGVESRP